MKNTKLILTAIVGLVLVSGTSRLLADDVGKAITITGSMVCGKCELHEAKSCQNVVQVTKDGKTVNYYLVQNDTSKAAHELICEGTPQKVIVTGSVEKKDGKQVLTATKIEAVKS
ncbi:MAG: DUF6370 family protein [Limisphaerales bacterium]